MEETSPPRRIPRAKDGRGPAWSNSLFEDAAEFGFGMRLTADKLAEYANELLDLLIASGQVGGGEGRFSPRCAGLTSPRRRGSRRRGSVSADLKKALAKASSPEEKRLLAAADHLIRKSVWIVGGDGWAYDIGYGGLDHVIASGRNVNVLVLDTQVYSNTGGQMSKATPVGAIAKFAAGGKPLGKKDLGMMAMSYGNVYVARIAFGANKLQTITRVQRGGRVRRPLPDHRLQPLHQPRLRPAQGHQPAEAGRRLGRVDAVPLQPEAEGGGQEPADPGLQGAHGGHRRVHVQRDQVPGAASR